MKKLRTASFFAGVGGIDLGCALANLSKTVYANEFDEYPAKILEANFDIKVDLRDIKDVQAIDVPDCDIILGGFPCQAFSIAGYRQGFQDEKGRGTLFFELLRLIKLKKPSIIFLENVKNLVGHDNGNTFRVILESLQAAGYNVKYKVLNADTDGNTPQNRERIYIIGFLDKETYYHFDFPKPVQRTIEIKDIIDFNNRVDECFYYTDKKYSAEMMNLIKQDVKKEYTCYQWRRKYVRENKSNVVPTLTANMGTGGHNVPLIKTKYGIRKMTPRECFSAQGFPPNFVLPKLSNGRLYKAAGNSVCVGVIKRIADSIRVAIEMQH